jgi:hypothetical protein
MLILFPYFQLPYGGEVKAWWGEYGTRDSERDWDESPSRDYWRP